MEPQFYLPAKYLPSEEKRLEWESGVIRHLEQDGKAGHGAGVDLPNVHAAARRGARGFHSSMNCPRAAWLSRFPETCRRISDPRPGCSWPRSWADGNPHPAGASPDHPEPGAAHPRRGNPLYAALAAARSRTARSGTRRSFRNRGVAPRTRPALGNPRLFALARFLGCRLRRRGAKFR